jgi:hypothetical protein
MDTIELAHGGILMLTSESSYPTLNHSNKKEGKQETVLNEKHLELFKEEPGLERRTIDHEAGHWVLDTTGLGCSTQLSPRTRRWTECPACLRADKEKGTARQGDFQLRFPRRAEHVRA